MRSYGKSHEGTIKVDKLAAHIADTFLSKVHISVHSAVVPFSAYLLGICSAGFTKTWTDKGNVARNKAVAQMSSLGRTRI